MVGKVNTLAGTPSAHTVKDSPLSRMLFELFDIILAASFFENLSFDFIHFYIVTYMEDTIAQLAKDLEVRTDD